MPNNKIVVAFVADFWEHVCPVLRISAPLRAAGWQLLHGNEFVDPNTVTVNLEAVKAAHLVIIQRDFPRFPQYHQVIELAHALHKPVVYELDDWLFDIDTNHHDSSFYHAARIQMLACLAMADVVTTTTPFLQQRLLQLHPNVQLLPNYLPDDLWQPQTVAPLNSDTSVLTIGYMGTHGHQADLLSIEPVLLQIANVYGARVRFWVCGVKPPEKLLANANVKVEMPYFINYAAFVQYFKTQRCDIWIAPLLDTAFNRAKSQLKFLEYSQSGTPGIYSPVAYSDIVSHQHNGLLAQTESEWLAALTQLLESPLLRQQLGNAAKNTVQQQGYLSAYAQQWDACYQNLITRPTRTVDRSVMAMLALMQTWDQTLQAENQTLRAENQTLQAENQTLQAENQTLQADNQDLRHARWQLEHSRVWRLNRLIWRVSSLAMPLSSKRRDAASKLLGLIRLVRPTQLRQLGYQMRRAVVRRVKRKVDAPIASVLTGSLSAADLDLPNLLPTADLPTVVVVFPFLAVGGAERLALQVLLSLRAQCRFIVVVLDPAPPKVGSLIDDFRAAAVAVYELAQYPHPPASMLQYILQRSAASTLYIANGCTWLYDRLPEYKQVNPQLRIVAQVYDHENGWIRRYDAVLARVIDCHIAPNPAIAAAYLAAGATVQQVQEIPHFIDITEFDPAYYHTDALQSLRTSFALPSNKLIVTFLARLHPQKRPFDFVELARRFVQNPNIHFWLVGDGELSPPIDAYLVKNPLPNLHKRGFYSPASAVLALTDVLVLPSQYEGMPMVMLEAAAMGVPVVVTDVGNNRAVLAKTGGGVLVPQIGDVEALQRGVQQMLLDPPNPAMLRQVICTCFSRAAVAPLYAKALLG